MPECGAHSSVPDEMPKVWLPHIAFRNVAASCETKVGSWSPNAIVPNPQPQLSRIVPAEHRLATDKDSAINTTCFFIATSRICLFRIATGHRAHILQTPTV